MFIGSQLCSVLRLPMRNYFLAYTRNGSLSNWSQLSKCISRTNFSIVFREQSCLANPSNNINPIPSVLRSHKSWLPPLCTARCHSQYQQLAGSPQQLSFQYLTNKKFDADMLIFEYNNGKECLLYNILTTAVFCTLCYFAYKIYFDAELGILETNAEYSPFLRNFDLNPMRIYITVGMLAAGAALLGLVMRYTLRSVNRLELLMAGDTVRLCTNTLLGTSTSRTFPLEKVYGARISAFLEGHETCRVYVQGHRLSYMLDLHGTVHSPYLLTNTIGAKKLFMEAYIEVDNDPNSIGRK